MRVSPAVMAACVALPLVVLTSKVLAQAPVFELRLESDQSSLIQTPEARLGKPGSELRFLGFSKNSRYIAYTRGEVGSREQPEQRMHRRLKFGEFDGFGEKVGLDVARFAHKEGYVITALPKQVISPTELLFDLDGQGFSLKYDIGSTHGWSLESDTRMLKRHQFDRIYVGIEAELYVAPNRKQGVLVMHLDKGWEIDAAIYPLWLSDEAPPKSKRLKRERAKK